MSIDLIKAPASAMQGAPIMQSTQIPNDVTPIVNQSAMAIRLMQGGSSLLIIIGLIVCIIFMIKSKKTKILFYYFFSKIIIQSDIE